MSKAQKQRSELDKQLVKPGYKTLLFINKINKYLKTTAYKDSKIDIKKVTKFDDRINVFWDVVKNHYDYIVTKNEKYLNWRYCDPRGGPYQIYVAEEDSKIVGYIVFRLNTTQKDYPEGYIVEVLALPKRLDAVDMLVKKVVNDFDAMEVNVVNAMLVYGNQYEVVLGKHDFLYNRDKVGVSFTPMKLGDVDLAKFTKAPPNRLNYQWGESDTI